MCVDSCRVNIGNPMFLKAIRRLTPQLLNSGANEKLTCPKTRASGGLSKLNVGVDICLTGVVEGHKGYSQDDSLFFKNFHGDEDRQGMWVFPKDRR